MRAADETWRVALTVPVGTAPIFAQAIEELASALSAFELAEGARVFHQKFGYGRVIAAEAGKLDIEFDKAGRKKVMDSFVQPA